MGLMKKYRELAGGRARLCHLPFLSVLPWQQLVDMSSELLKIKFPTTGLTSVGQIFKTGMQVKWKSLTLCDKKGIKRDVVIFFWCTWEVPSHCRQVRGWHTLLPSLWWFSQLIRSLPSQCFFLVRMKEVKWTYLVIPLSTVTGPLFKDLAATATVSYQAASSCCLYSDSRLNNHLNKYILIFLWLHNSNVKECSG